MNDDRSYEPPPSEREEGTRQGCSRHCRTGAFT